MTPKLPGRPRLLESRGASRPLNLLGCLGPLDPLDLLGPQDALDLLDRLYPETPGFPRPPRAPDLLGICKTRDEPRERPNQQLLS